MILRTSVLAAYFGTIAIGGAAETIQVDLKPDGTSFENVSDAALAGDGRVVILVTTQKVLPIDTNGGFDVYARDLTTGALDLVSVGLAGVAGSGGSLSPAVSEDGRYVAFASSSTNLVANDTNGKGDVFVRDRLMGTTEIVSVSSSGALGDFNSSQPAISADGRYVAFTSTATTLVPGDLGGSQDVFVHDRVTKVTTRVNVDANGVHKPGSSGSPSLSADGRYVAFGSSQGLVPPVVGYSEFMVKDRMTGAIVRASVNDAGEPANAQVIGGSLSPDGRYAMFTTNANNVVMPDTNGKSDVFVRDLVANVTEALAVTPQGVLGNGTSSGVGHAANAFSADGRFVVFHSTSTSLTPVTNSGGTGFLRDRLLDTTSRLTFSPFGLPPNDSVGPNAISSDGTRVLLFGYATNLVSPPTNGLEHAFVRVRTGFQDLHGGIPGAGGTIPSLTGSGTLEVGGSGVLTLTGAPASTPSVRILSLGFAQTPFFGGTIAAYPPFHLSLGVTDFAGSETLTWSIGHTPVLAAEAYLQIALPDAAAPQGVTLSNVLYIGLGG